jgi:hypothetical protein
VVGEDESGQVPNWMKDVVSDLQRPKPINVQVGFAPAGIGGHFWIWELDAGGDSAGCGMGRDDSPEARVQLADWLQEQFFAETRGAWGEARPECPSHSHPAVSKELNGEAWWICPVDGHRVGQIGRLGE